MPRTARGGLKRKDSRHITRWRRYLKAVESWVTLIVFFSLWSARHLHSDIVYIDCCVEGKWRPGEHLGPPMSAHSMWVHTAKQQRPWGSVTGCERGVKLWRDLTPLSFCIDFKIVFLIFKVLRVLTPTYNAGLLTPSEPEHHLRASEKTVWAVPQSGLNSRVDCVFSCGVYTLVLPA